MKLYHNPMSRSTRPNWLLEELGLDAERVMVDFASGEHKKPEFLAINPLGQLPAYVEGDVVLTESLAICLYLADAHGPQLIPPVGPARASYYRWMAYSIGTIEPRAMTLFGAKGDPEKLAQAKASLDASVQVIADAFGDGPWLLGEQFTTADIMLGSTLMWLVQMKTITVPPVLGAWLGRLMQRPSWQRAFAQG